MRGSKFTFFKSFLVFLLFLVLSDAGFVTSFAVDDGKVLVLGKTYEIVERDALEEIIEKATFAKEEIKRLFLDNFKRTVEKKFKLDGLGLEKASKNNTYKVVPKLTLDVDLVDHEGRIIYPRGFTYNPLKYVKLPFKLYFIDFTSEKEVSFLKSELKNNREGVIIFMTKGDLRSLPNLGYVVYPARKRFVDFFKIKRTPSLVYQEKDYFVVKEVAVY